MNIACISSLATEPDSKDVRREVGGWRMAESWLQVLAASPVYGRCVCKRPQAGARDFQGPKLEFWGQAEAKKLWASPQEMLRCLRRPLDRWWNLTWPDTLGSVEALVIGLL